MRVYNGHSYQHELERQLARSDVKSGGSISMMRTSKADVRTSDQFRCPTRYPWILVLLVLLNVACGARHPSDFLNQRMFEPRLAGVDYLPCGSAAETLRCYGGPIPEPGDFDAGRIELSDDPLESDAYRRKTRWLLQWSVGEEQLTRVVNRLSIDHEAMGVADRNELAVSLILRGRSEQSLQDLLAALDILADLARTESTIPEVHFNLALVLSDLGLHEVARRWWEHVAAAMPAENGWSHEAQLHLDSMHAVRDWRDFLSWSGPTDEDTLKAQLERDAQAALEAILDHLVPRYPSIPADEQKAIDALARRLAVGTGDSSGLRILESWKSLAVENRARYREAFQRYGEARSLYEDGRYEDADQLFLAAIRLIDDRMHPLVLWSESWRAGILLARGGYSDLDLQLEDLAPLVEVYPVLKGRLSWIRGVSLLRAGDAEGAISYYRSAASILSKAGQAEAVTALNALIAEAYRALGYERQAWYYNGRALQGFGSSRRSPLLSNILLQIAEMASDNGYFTAALALLEEGVLLNQDDAISRAEFLRWSAEIRSSLGDVDAGLELADASLEAAGFAGSPEVVRYLSSMAQLTRARSLLDTNLNEAAAALETARHGMGDLPRAFSIRDLYLLETKLSLRRGRIADAERRLARVLERPDAASGAFAEAPEELLVEWLGSLAQITESGMFARVLAPLEGVGLGRSVEAAEVDAAVRQFAGPGELRHIVRFATSPEYLIVWVFGSDGSIELDRVDWRHDSYLRTIRDFERNRRLAVTDRLDGRLLDSLSSKLLPAVCKKVRAGSPLTIVPAMGLEAIPFAALSCPGGDEYLIERNELRLSSSLITAVGSESLKRRETALIVGDPAFDRELFPDSSRLPWAGREVRAISEHYRDFEMLTDSDASALAVREKLNSRPFDVVHWSGHAIASKRKPGGYLLTSRSEKGGTSTLPLSDLAASGIDGSLVILATCSLAPPLNVALPGRGVGARDIHVFEVARPLLTNGAEAVVLSLWEVDDKETMSLMVRFHAALSLGTTPAKALREAQLGVLSEPGGRSSTAWAAFVPVTG